MPVSDKIVIKLAAAKFTARIRDLILQKYREGGYDARGSQFRPDWCCAPSGTLRKWLDENGLSPEALAVVCDDPPRKHLALALIREVLDRKPLRAVHADYLERGTGISERFWLARERHYREGLAAGLKDVSDDWS
jgi:hypothetical protein